MTIKEVIKNVKLKQKRISEIQMQAQKLQMQVDKFLGTQADIVNIGKIGNEMINQAIPM